MASFHRDLLILLLLLSAAAVVPATRHRHRRTRHFHFYMHDTLSGSKPSAVNIVKGRSSIPPVNGLGFGDVFAVDDPLTEGPSASSALVGRAQGFYMVASQSQKPEEFALMLTVNLVFSCPAYNGSTLAVLSRDAIYAAERELPVVGGTGKFRMARGYAILKTYSFDQAAGDAVLELDVYVVQ